MSSRPGWLLAGALPVTLVLDAAVGRALGLDTHRGHAGATATDTDAYRLTTYDTAKERNHHTH